MSVVLKRSITRTARAIGKGSNAAAGIGHLSLSPFSFHFKLEVLKISGGRLKQERDVVVIVERRGKLVATELLQVENQTVCPQKLLAFDATLFRMPGEGNFQSKIVKLAVRQGSKNGRTIGKVRLDLAENVGATETETFAEEKLSDGSFAVLRIFSKLVSGRDRCAGRSGNESEFTRMTSGSGEFSQAGSLDADGAIFDEDFDLALETGDAVFEPVSKPSKSVNSRILSKRSFRSIGESAYLQKLMSKAHTELEDAHRLNAELKWKTEALRKRYAELEEDFHALQTEAEENLEELNQREAENERLRDELAELKDHMKREPQLEDVVNELKAMKLEVAVAITERDQALLHLKQGCEGH